MTRTELARVAMRGAAEVRLQARADLASPVCAYDLAHKLGVSVRFVAGNTFGGMFSKTANVILVPTLRPPGRRAMTCAHELGHWHYDHGTRVEDLDDTAGEDSAEEYLARLFGHFLLMPPRGVKAEMARRGMDPSTCTASDIYRVASQMGVAYEALVRHLARTMGIITSQRSRDLLATSPKQIRQSLLGLGNAKHLVVVDDRWHAVAVDLEVDDYIILPAGTAIVGRQVLPIRETATMLVARAAAPGICNAANEATGWATFIRVCRREFTGLALYRHLEEIEDEATVSVD